MDMRAYVDEIKLSVTGGVLELEIGDETIMQIVNSALRELQRYICSTRIVTVPYEKCIDMSKQKVNAIARVYRAQASGTTSQQPESGIDPMQIGLWQLTSGVGNMYNFSDYVNRFASWSTIQQVSNTLSTDLAWYYEDAEKRLYINTRLDSGSQVTIEYIPRYDDVSEITSDFWIDVLMRLSKALTKITLGRIRGRFTQSNALWTSDAAAMLQEGHSELSELRTYLQQNTQLLNPLD